MRRIVRWLGMLLIVAFIAIQLVPYGRRHTNPPVTQEPAWDQIRTRNADGPGVLRLPQ
jgi:hypothetical protein